MIIGIDMGGTNIDGVVLHQDRIQKTFKQPVDGSDYFASIWHCLEALIEGLDRTDIKRIQLSTTISTNAIVENKVAQVGVILQPGPGLNWSYDHFGERLKYISGSIDHRGSPVRVIDRKELRQIRDEWSDLPIDALAIVTKFSVRNPDFEHEIEKFFSNDYPDITLGHRLSGKLNFPRRVETAYLNAAVSRTFRTFAEQFQQALEQADIQAPVYILKADGGTIDLEGAIEKPVETILSGPAASFMGMKTLLHENGNDRLLIDIGGTTTDLFLLVDDVPIFEPLGITINQRKTLVRAIFSHSIGLGGDSYVRFEEGQLLIGPERKGHAIAFGGKHLTPTDALVYLDRLKGERGDESREAIEVLAKEHGLSGHELAENIITKMGEMISNTVDAVLEKLNGSPVYTVRELLSDRTIKPDSIGLVGGPAEALAETIHQSLGLPIDYPADFAIANAIGAALAKPTVEINLLADTERNILSVPELGIYQTLRGSLDLATAKQFAMEQVKLAGQTMGLSKEQLDTEIVEASIFNMLNDDYGVEKNIRVRAQIRPGLLTHLQREGGYNESKE